MTANGDPPATGPGGGGGLPDGFLFGVATAGYQVEGGYNGPGEPANNWVAWEQAGRVEPSGNAVGFWDRPEEALDRAAALGCNSFRLGVEWARVLPDERGPDRAALARYGDIVSGCVDRGLEPLVTLHHFTHPAWLGEDFWLRPDAPDRYRAWAEMAVDALAPSVRHWVTINEVNVLATASWLLGMFPPGRSLVFDDAAVAADNLLAAHVLGYEVVHRARADAVVTTNNACLSLYEYDRMLTDLLVARSAGVDRGEIAAWLDERRRRHDSLLPANSAAERVLRRLSAAMSPYRHQRGGGGTRGGRGPRLPRRALDAIYDSPHERTLDALALDYYDPMAARHFRMPGHRTAGGRSHLPTRELWDDVPDPAGLSRWLGVQHALVPGLPLWVVENGMCNRVVNGRSYIRQDGWDRPRYLRENIGAVVEAIDQGVPVTGYWHWSLVDNYEWGSYEPRFGLHGVDRHRGEHGMRWLDSDSLGDDSAGTYRAIIAGLRAGDRSALRPH
ncbi:MAG TPA: family 1 glycosylhydrolase [Acidimicrobiales bacterium]|nr:family 1 glycosylhydrolase [Acidimicrobiales bacterium]